MFSRVCKLPLHKLALLQQLKIRNTCYRFVLITAGLSCWQWYDTWGRILHLFPTSLEEGSHSTEIHCRFNELFLNILHLDTGSCKQEMLTNKSPSQELDWQAICSIKSQTFSKISISWKYASCFEWFLCKGFPPCWPDKKNLCNNSLPLPQYKNIFSNLWWGCHLFASWYTEQCNSMFWRSS